MNALCYIRDGDLLTVQEVDRLGRNLLEGLIALNDLFQRGVGVKVLEGVAAAEKQPSLTSTSSADRGLYQPFLVVDA